MSVTAHTPGAWFADVDGFGGNRVGAFGFDTYDGTQILAQFRSPEGVSFEMAKANARLSAAAPDMLAALMEIDAWSRRQNIALPSPQIYAAIAKAKGVTP